MLDQVLPDLQRWILQIRNLDSRSAIGVFLALLVVTVVLDAVYNIFFHPLAHVPGPWLAKFSCLSFEKRFLTGQEHLEDAKLFKKYGPVVRTAPNLVVFNQPAWLPLVYNRTADKGETYQLSGIFGLVGVRSHIEHGIARRRLVPSFTKTAIHNLRPIVNGLIEQWIEVLNERAAAGETFDISPYTSYLTYDVLANLCFGGSLGFIEHRKDVQNLIKGFDDDVAFFGVLVRSTVLVKWLLRAGFAKLIMPSPKDKSGLGVVMKVRDDLLEERLKNPVDRPDILNSLLETKNPDGTTGPPLEALKNEILLLMIAGNDTTSILLRDMIFQICSRPEAMERIRSAQLDAPAAHAELNYLTACIKETIRYGPPVGTPFPRISPPEGLRLGDIFIPAGFEVYAAGWSVHRNKDVFGDDADDWNPERWFPIAEVGQEQEKLRLGRMERSIYAWGYGPRICIGRPLAEMESFTAIRRFLETFDVELKVELEFEDQPSYGLRRHRGMFVKLTKRE